jgi:hypothetical protein
MLNWDMEEGREAMLDAVLGVHTVVGAYCCCLLGK